MPESLQGMAILWRHVSLQGLLHYGILWMLICDNYLIFIDISEIFRLGYFYSLGHIYGYENRVCVR